MVGSVVNGKNVAAIQGHSSVCKSSGSRLLSSLSERPPASVAALNSLNCKYHNKQ